jgi:hypothetical protein
LFLSAAIINGQEFERPASQIKPGQSIKQQGQPAANRSKAGENHWQTAWKAKQKTVGIMP